MKIKMKLIKVGETEKGIQFTRFFEIEKNGTIRRLENNEFCYHGGLLEEAYYDKENLGEWVDCDSKDLTALCADYALSAYEVFGLFGEKPPAPKKFKVVLKKGKKGDSLLVLAGGRFPISISQKRTAELAERFSANGKELAKIVSGKIKIEDGKAIVA